MCPRCIQLGFTCVRCKAKALAAERGRMAMHLPPEAFLSSNDLMAFNDPAWPADLGEEDEEAFDEE